MEVCCRLAASARPCGRWSRARLSSSKSNFQPIPGIDLSTTRVYSGPRDNSSNNSDNINDNDNDNDNDKDTDIDNKNAKNTGKKFRLVCLVGFPGSGKSTFATQLKELGSFVSVNQDSLGSRQKCVAMAQRVLGGGGRVVVDRCNVSHDERRMWAGLRNVRVPREQRAIVHILTDPSECVARVANRKGDHPTITTTNIDTIEGIVKKFEQRLQPPDSRRDGYSQIFRARTRADLEALLQNERFQ